MTAFNRTLHKTLGQYIQRKTTADGRHWRKNITTTITVRLRQQNGQHQVINRGTECNGWKQSHEMTVMAVMKESSHAGRFKRNCSNGSNEKKKQPSSSSSSPVRTEAAVCCSQRGRLCFVWVFCIDVVLEDVAESVLLTWAMGCFGSVLKQGVSYNACH